MKENINFAYKVVMNMFSASSTISEKNLTETEAIKLAEKLLSVMFILNIVL